MIRAKLTSALRRSGRIAVECPRTALWTLLAVTCALFVVGAAAIAGASVDAWARDRPGASASMVVYLDNATAERQAALVGELRALHGVEQVELVPAAESARRLVASLGADAALLEGVDISTLPASIEVKLAPGVRDVVAMSPTIRALTTGVEVVVENAEENKIAGVLATVRQIAWTGAALFAGLALITILASIRVRLDPRGREMHVVHLLGGSSAFVIVPRALAGALSGVVAALLAAVGIQLVLAIYGDAIERVLATSLVAPAALHVALFVGVAALLGLVGGGIAGASRVAR
ncbi:MAG TPA: permease-like cell division protein FtsX [Kofleriaceae bacterium]|nr:permease-like cell division protein FtsX [Kofleriaceae bacterium]